LQSVHSDRIELAEAETKSMDDAGLESLIFDLLTWVANGERDYDEVMDAWRTSCPKLPVWEDASDRGFVISEGVGGRCVVRITAAGVAFLDQRKRTRS
jgi:D-3-phosphoglycerate dehydrogenase